MTKLETSYKMELAIIIIVILGLGYGVNQMVKDNALGTQNASLDSLFQKYGIEYGVDWLLLKAIAEQESNLNPNAINKADPSFGLMQIQDGEVWSTAIAYLTRLGLDISKYNLPDDLYNPDINIMIAGKFIQEIITKYGLDSIDIYNIGETSYLKGYRNLTYRDQVLAKYAALKENN